MLDYGYKSRCCRAPIRLGFKKSPYKKLSIKTWVCTKCRRSNIDIIPNSEVNNQDENKYFSDYSRERD
jgi:hypothetical protein